MRLIALIIFGLMAVLGLTAVTPASAQYAGLRPAGAVPLLDGCQGEMGYPDCHPDRVYYVPTAAASAPAVTHRSVHRHRQVTQTHPAH
jgi:hypothetical protein